MGFGILGRPAVKWNRMMAATLLGCSGLNALAQTNDVLPLLPKWDHLIVLHAAGGYKDNPTLAHTDPEGSSFVKLGADAMVFNLNPDGPQFQAFVSGEHRQYFSAPSVDNEDLVFGTAELKLPIHDHGQASLAAEYIFQNQVLDVSISETNRQAVLVRGHTLTARPGLRLNLLGPTWLALSTPLTRQLLVAPLDDYWEGGPRAELGLDYGHQSYLTLSYQAAWRAYDNDPALDSEGTTMTGTHRRFLAHEGRVTWRHYWDAARHWRTTTKLGLKVNRDNGGRYFDYDRLSGSEELRYRTQVWELSARVRVAYYRYPVQTVSLTDLRHRERTEIGLSAGCERRLAKSLRLVAGYEYERTVSNLELESYTVNSFNAGMDWEF